MKLGDKVIFQKHLVKGSCSYSYSLEETKAFIESKKKPWVGNRNEAKHALVTENQPKEGIVCGVRIIDLTGSYDYEDGYYSGVKTKVYLIATGLNSFYKVPEEFINREVQTNE